MERITYRITLDAHKNGIQRTLQGFETADNMSRKIAINLVASEDTYEIPFDHVVAMMYVTTPNADEPSINECSVDGDTIIYDVLPITEEGITEMQLKLIETRPNGARSVLVSPKFAVEVHKSGTNDESVIQTATFTSLENALAQSKAVYDSRLLRIEITDDCRFKAYYADGSVYENDYLYDALYNGNALLAESYAHGNTGIRDGENTDNAMYYKDVARSTLAEARDVNERSEEIMNEMYKHSIYTVFSVDFESGHLVYESQNYSFSIDENGELAYETLV
jgi:hypothetical protein